MAKGRMVRTGEGLALLNRIDREGLTYEPSKHG